MTRAIFPLESISSAGDDALLRLSLATEGSDFQRGIPMLCSHVILADSHFDMLGGLRRMIEAVAESVIMVADEPSLIRAIYGMKPDLIIADLSFQVSGTANVVQLIKRHRPACKVIVVSLYDNPTIVKEAMEAGAAGFVLKRRAVVDLVPAVHRVIQNRLYVSVDGFCDDREG
jgi:DNA-binding NarL/FixJ family response regulator